MYRRFKIQNIIGPRGLFFEIQALKCTLTTLIRKLLQELIFLFLTLTVVFSSSRGSFYTIYVRGFLQGAPRYAPLKPLFTLKRRPRGGKRGFRKSAPDAIIKHISGCSALHFYYFQATQIWKIFLSTSPTRLWNWFVKIINIQEVIAARPKTIKVDLSRKLETLMGWLFNKK